MEPRVITVHGRPREVLMALKDARVQCSEGHVTTVQMEEVVPRRPRKRRAF